MHIIGLYKWTSFANYYSAVGQNLLADFMPRCSNNQCIN